MSKRLLIGLTLISFLFIGATQAQERQITIEYWYSLGSVIESAIPAIEARFEEENPDINVEIRSYPDYETVLQALQTSIAAGSAPDVVQIGYNHTNFVGEVLPYFPISSAIALDEAGDGETWLSSFPSTVLELGQFEGNQVGMPMIIGSPYLLYNVDLFAQAGLTRAPETWEEVREFARTITEATGVKGFGMPDGLDFWNYQALVESNGAQLLQVVDGTYTTGVGSPEAIEAMQLIANMILVDETALNVDWGSGIPAFLGGELAMFMGSSGLVIGIQNTVPFTLGTAPYPVFEGRERRVPAGGSNNFIFATEPEQQLAAFKFIQSLMSPESMTEWVAATGFLPPRPELAEDPQFLQPFYEANPLIQVEFDQVENVVPWVSWPGEFGPEANAILADTRDMILTGTVTTEDGMQSAAQEINELISR